MATEGVAVAAAVVSDATVAAGVALLDMAAQRRGPAELDGAHDPQPGTAERAGMLLAVCRAVAAEHVRHLEFHPAHRPQSGNRQG